MGARIRLADVPETPTSEGRWQALNRLSGLQNFGLNAVAIEPGEQMDIAHDESNSQHQEAYIVVTGRAGFRVGDEDIEAGPGDVVVVPDPAVRRDFWALAPDTRIVCVGAGPAGADPDYGAWIASGANAEATDAQD